MAKKLTTKEFIERAKEIHGEFYDYSLVEYINSSTKVKVICPIHGIFKVVPYSHATPNKTGAKCRKCQGFGRTTEDFIAEAKKVHGEQYDYSKSIYKKAREKIIVICPKHGEWKTTHHSHAVNGHGCQKCGSHKRAPELEEIITKFRSVHADRYDYSLVSWNEQGEHGWWSKVTIICSRHGQFRMTPAVHYFQKANCQKCAYEGSGLSQRKSLEEFIYQAKKRHGNTYSYTKTKYSGDQKNLVITCKKHGDFPQRADHHLNGSGCPKCYNKSEGKIAIYLNLHHIVHRQFGIENRYFDFYLPDYNLIIERDGEQHYLKVWSRPSSQIFSKREGRSYKTSHQNDIYKTQLAKKNGYKIARIPYWLEDTEVELEIENILAGYPTYPDVPDPRQEETKPTPEQTLKN